MILGHANIRFYAIGSGVQVLEENVLELVGPEYHPDFWKSFPVPYMVSNIRND